jgi:hypothetical protein
MSQPNFYLAKQPREFRIRTQYGVESRVGRPAYVPGLPGLHFFYREEDNEHILTEESTGLALARERVYGIGHLHQAVGHIVRIYGLQGTLKRIGQWSKLPSATPAIC